MIDENYNVKLSDFGFSAFASNKGMSSGLVGTVDYMAPEILLGKSHDIEVDIWALGVLLYEMTHGTIPFPEKDIKSKSRNICFQEPIYNHKCSSELKDLISKLLCREKSDRPNIDYLFKDQWMNNFGDLSKKFIAKRNKYNLSIKLRGRTETPCFNNDFVNDLGLTPKSNNSKLRSRSNSDTTSDIRLGDNRNMHKKLRVNKEYDSYQNKFDLHFKAPDNQIKDDLKLLSSNDSIDDNYVQKNNDYDSEKNTHTSLGKPNEPNTFFKNFGYSSKMVSKKRESRNCSTPRKSLKFERNFTETMNRANRRSSSSKNGLNKKFLGNKQTLDDKATNKKKNSSNEDEGWFGRMLKYTIGCCGDQY